MTYNFNWKNNNRPTFPSAEDVEDAIKAALRYFKDPRNICFEDSNKNCSLVVDIFLEQDKNKSKVEGVGYSKDDKPIVTFRYSLRAPMYCLCDYYDNPINIYT